MWLCVPTHLTLPWHFTPSSVFLSPCQSLTCPILHLPGTWYACMMSRLFLTSYLQVIFQPVKHGMQQADNRLIKTIGCCSSSQILCPWHQALDLHVNMQGLHSICLELQAWAAAGCSICSLSSLMPLALCTRCASEHHSLHSVFMYVSNVSSLETCFDQHSQHKVTEQRYAALQAAAVKLQSTDVIPQSFDSSLENLC